MTRFVLLLSLLWILAWTPQAALAQGDDAPMPEPTSTPVDEANEAGKSEANTGTDVVSEVDPLDASLRTLVQSYYERIGSESTESDVAQGMKACKLMLMDGVSLGRIEAGVDRAISLHTPGRRIPFQVAVPLRVRPAGETSAAPRPAPKPMPDSVARPESGEPREDATGSSSTAQSDPAERAGTVIEERWVKRQEELRARRNRLRLYLQWRDRTREKRVLLSVGVPMLVAGWAGTWALAGGTLSTGAELPSVGWTGAIPIAGPIIFGALTEGAYPPIFVFGGFQTIGLVLTIAGLAQKHDLPYDRDPTAMNVGRNPRTGRAVLTLSPRPVGLGGGVVGRF